MRHGRFLVGILLASAAFFAPVIAFAQYEGPVICSGLFGCGGGMADIFLSNTLPTAGGILIQLAAGGAVVAIVIAGVQMVVSGGDEGKITNARKAIMYAIGGLGVAFAATSIVSFVATQEYGQNTGGQDFLFGAGGVMSWAIQIILTLFNVAFALVIIIAGIRMVVSSGNADEFKKAGGMIKWAIVGSVIVTVARAGIQAFLMVGL